MLDEETHGVPLYYPPVELCTGKSESGGSGGSGESGDCKPEFGESGVLRTDQLGSDPSEVHLSAHSGLQDDRDAEPVVFFPFFVYSLRSHSHNTPCRNPIL